MVQNIPPSSLSLRIRVCHPNTRTLVGLLGPCFKTGRLKPFRQHPKRWCGKRPGRRRAPGSQHKSVCPGRPPPTSRYPGALQSSVQGGGMTRGYNTSTEVLATFPGLSTPRPN